MSKTLYEIFGAPLHVYTRADALADGVLIDVSETAQQYGFKIPVALTEGVWNDCVKWASTDSVVQTHQDEGARLGDVLWMAYLAAKAGQGVSIVPFQLLRIPRDGRDTKPRLTRLKMIIGPGDTGEPVLTILLPNED